MSRREKHSHLVKWQRYFKNLERKTKYKRTAKVTTTIALWCSSVTEPSV